MKNAIIVGASSGMGNELAKRLAGDGYRVGITGRRFSLLTELKASMPLQIFPMEMDACDLNSIDRHLNDLVLQLGGLDLLIISAGTGELNPQLDFGLEKQTIDVNVSGFTAIADWAFNYFARQKHGTLASITSIAALRGNRQSPAYSASKAYQVIYLEGLRQKAFRDCRQISIIDIRPGYVDTKMAKGENIFWVSPVKKACDQIMEGIHSRKPVVYITRRWRIIAWALRLLPGFVHKRL
jgi:short-subunit dehydrogenase